MKKVCVCKVEAMPAAMSHTLSHRVAAWFSMRFKPPSSRRLKVSFFSWIIYFSVFHNSRTANPLLPRQNSISACGNLSAFFLCWFFFFFFLRKVVDAVWVSRVAFKAGNAYSWPVCFLCTVSLCLHPFGPFRFYQQFYPSWMPLYVVEEYCFKMTTIGGKKGADIKVHTHYIKGVTVRTKTLNRVAGNCKMHTSFDQAIKCYDKVNTPEY